MRTKIFAASIVLVFSGGLISIDAANGIAKSQEKALTLISQIPPQLDKPIEVQRGARASRFSPGVEEYLSNFKGNRSRNSTPDPDENIEVVRGVKELEGSPKEEKSLRDLVQKFPNSRSARRALAGVYGTQYKQSRDKRLAKLALEQYMAASEAGAKFRNFFYTNGIKDYAVESGEYEIGKRWFEKILAQNPGEYVLNIDYARLLSMMNDERADIFFQKSIELRSAGDFNSNVYYTEYLLSRQRYPEALKSSELPVGENSYYIDFLHGYALEKLGRGEEAVTFYKRFVEFSSEFPAPKRFQIGDSKFQQGIQFSTQATTDLSVASPEINLQKTVKKVVENTNLYMSFSPRDGMIVAQAQASTVAPATSNLSWANACESGPSETPGARRQVAWSIRQRVNRGTVAPSGNTCLYVNNAGGANYNIRYANVICQSTQYEGVVCNSSSNVTKCGPQGNTNSRDPISDQIATEVYNGRVADPFTNWCPSGTASGNACVKTCNGSVNNITNWTPRTPHSFLANSPTPPYSCMSAAQNVCGNGGLDNYFYYSN
jgi:tetratricopeptide (TPR) repeat protein